MKTGSLLKYCTLAVLAVHLHSLLWIIMSPLQKGITFSYCYKSSVDKNAELPKCYLTTTMTNWQAAEIKETYSEGPSIIKAMSSKPIKHFSILSQDHVVD